MHDIQKQVLKEKVEHLNEVMQDVSTIMMKKNEVAIKNIDNGKYLTEDEELADLVLNELYISAKESITSLSAFLKNQERCMDLLLNNSSKLEVMNKLMNKMKKRHNGMVN
jgi:hypothetical protein